MAGLVKACWQYTRYVVRHKIAVYKEARHLGLSIWQSFAHDWSKFLPSEFIPYMNHFNRGRTGPGYEGYDRAFDIAWLHHIHLNPHHWQHWILQTDTEGIKVLRMPEKYVKEMVADWRGVGVALGKGRDNATQWYHEFRETLSLHPQTRSRVEVLLGLKQSDKYVQTVSYPTPRIPGT